MSGLSDVYRALVGLIEAVTRLIEVVTEEQEDK